jgi:hypothetical protein
LSQNTHCQLRASVRKPPISGPSANPSPTTAAQIPIAPVRRSGGKLTPRIDSETGTITADPRPWSARPPISIAGPVESAITSEASAYTPIPTANTRRRP